MPDVVPKCVSQTHPVVEGQIVWDRSTRFARSVDRNETVNASGACPALVDDRQRQHLVHLKGSHDLDDAYSDGSEVMVGDSKLEQFNSFR